MLLQRKINDVDVSLLRFFKAGAECGGFSAVETELNIARSTISTHMADLEARLGLILCRPGRSGFIPCHHELGSISYLPLHQEPYQLYCGKEHPLFDPADEVISEDLIKQQRFIHPGIQTNPQASQVINKLQRRAAAYHYEARLALLQTGLYIGYFPEHYACELVAQGE